MRNKSLIATFLGMVFFGIFCLSDSISFYAKSRQKMENSPTISASGRIIAKEECSFDMSRGAGFGVSNSRFNFEKIHIERQSDTLRILAPYLTAFGLGEEVNLTCTPADSISYTELAYNHSNCIRNTPEQPGCVRNIDGILR